MKIKTSLFTLGLLLVLFASKASAQSISPTPTTSANVATTSSVAPSTIVKTYEFVTDKQPFNYTLAPRSLVENNTTYLYRSIEYDILEEIPVMKEETQTFQREINRMNLNKQNDSLFPSSLTISENGYSGSIARTAVRYQTRTEKVASTPYGKEISYGYSLNTPTPKDHITIEHNGQNVDLKLKEFKEKSSKWQENVLVNAVFISDNELTFTLDNGKELSFDSDNPPYSGIENDILEQLKLDAGTHRITGSSWVNDLQVKDGYCTRTAKYKVSRLVKSYIAVYSGEAQNEDKNYFDATALYSGALSKRAETGAFTYKVNALVTYDAEIKITPSPSPSPTPTPMPTPTLTPSPTPMLTLEPSIEPEIIEEPKKKSGALGTLIMVLVVCGLAGGGFFLWQKKQGQNDD